MRNSNFEPLFLSFKDAKKATLFLQQVVHGEQANAMAILKSHPNVLFRQGKVIDYSGRTFNRISAFQYAAWALDMSMLRMLLKHVPKNQKHIASQQLKELLEGEMEHGKCTMAIEALKSALEAYLVYSREYPLLLLDSLPLHVQCQLNRLWLEIGKMQRLLPVHVINEYFHPNFSFSNERQFDDGGALPRCMWFDDGSSFYPLQENTGLGFDFSIFRGPQEHVVRMATGREDVNQSWAVGCDYKVLGRLLLERRREVEQIEQQLSNQTSERVFKARIDAF